MKKICILCIVVVFVLVALSQERPNIELIEENSKITYAHDIALTGKWELIEMSTVSKGEKNILKGKELEEAGILGTLTFYENDRFLQTTNKRGNQPVREEGAWGVEDSTLFLITSSPNGKVKRGYIYKIDGNLLVMRMEPAVWVEKIITTYRKK